MRIRVALRDTKGTRFLEREIKRVTQVSELDLEKIAKSCESIIKNTIMSKARKPTGRLASGFYAHKITNGWAIGDIAELDSTIPYWNHIDKGSLGIGANWNHYLPKGFWIDGRWVESDTGFAGIQPKTPIPAMNYIAETIHKMDTTIIPQILKG
jgi:hypothetical protein